MQINALDRVSCTQEDRPVITGTLRVEPQTVINPAIVGGGVNFAFSDYVYTDFVTGGGFYRQLPYSADPEEEERLWEEYFQLADYMGMRYIRLQVSYTQWDPIGGVESGVLDMTNRFIFSPRFRERSEAEKVPQNTYLYMEKLYRLLDFFEKKDAFVILGNWSGGGSAQCAAGFCPDNLCWLTGESVPGRQGFNVASVVDFADSFAGMMYHLIVEKGYSCVKGFSVFNEPEHFLHYIDELSAVYNACGESLKKLGIRERVMIQGVDGPIMWSAANDFGEKNLSELLERCGEELDCLSLHHYVSTFASGECLPNMETIMQGTVVTRLTQDFLNPILSMADKRPLFIGELGTFAFGDNNAVVEFSTKDFRLPLYNAEAACFLFNNGAKGYGLWNYNTLEHPYFCILNVDEHNADRFVPDAVNYYPNALAMKYFSSGMDIVASEMEGGLLEDTPRVFATVGVRGKDTTLLLVNDSNQDAVMTLCGMPDGLPYTCWYVDKEHTDRILMEGSYTLSDDVQIRLRPRSITVLTTYTYGTPTVFDEV